MMLTWLFPTRSPDHALGRQLVVYPAQQAIPRYIDPMLKAWEQAPDMMADFVRALLLSASETGLEPSGFIELWYYIGKRVLASERVRSRRFQHDHSMEDILATLIFADPFATCADLIEEWCATVGSVPACFRALIRLLDSVGFPVLVTHGVGWLHIALASALPADQILDEGSIASALAQLLVKAYAQYGSELPRTTETWQRFNRLVDQLASIGEPSAVDLQQRIRAR